MIRFEFILPDPEQLTRHFTKKPLPFVIGNTINASLLKKVKQIYFNRIAGLGHTRHARPFNFNSNRRGCSNSIRMGMAMVATAHVPHLHRLPIQDGKPRVKSQRPGT